MLRNKISALQHIRFSPDWLHHSVQGVFWDNEIRWWLKYLVWQRETLSRAVVSAPAKAPLVELLVHWAKVKLGWCWGDAEVMLEDLRCWAAQLCSTIPASASPRAEQMLSPRWSHRTCSLPGCEAGLTVGHRNLCQHQELCATTDPGDPSRISALLRKLQSRPQSWNTELCLPQMRGWNLISDAANKFRNCLLLTGALSRTAECSSGDTQEKENQVPCPAECCAGSVGRDGRALYSHKPGFSLPTDFLGLRVPWNNREKFFVFKRNQGSDSKEISTQ